MTSHGLNDYTHYKVYPVDSKNAVRNGSWY